MNLIFSSISQGFQPPRLDKISVSAVSRESNFASGGGIRTINEKFVDDLGGQVVWQPDVYGEAFELARRLNIENVIDLGCGSGDKLVYCAQNYKIKFLGLDFNGSIDVARREHPDHDWATIDLMSWDVHRDLLAELKSRLPAVIVLSDVIEHLPDVQPVLTLIRKLLSYDENSYLVLSTPDRTRQNRQVTDGASPNAAHVREWALPELCDLISNAGLEISRAGWTRCNQWDEFHTTCFIQAGFNAERYKTRLRKTFGTSEEWWPEHILITSEMHGATASGGVGSFIIEQQNNYGREKVIVLVATDGLVAADGRPYATMTPEDVLQGIDVSSLPVEDRVLRAIEQLLFLFPDVVSIQSQEYQGIGCRVAQAKRSGLLRDEVSVVTHCHGNTHYLENGKKDWYGVSHMVSSIKEKVAIENADVVCFPSVFLRELYSEVGIELGRQKIEMRRYPYSPTFDTVHPMGGIDTLVFFGKRTLMKGFKLFLEAISIDDGKALVDFGIKDIVLIGGAQPETADFDYLVETLKDRFTVSIYDRYARDEAILCLRGLAARSLVVMPYLADNYPFSIYDAMSANALPVVVEAGGVPEMLPSEFTSRLVAKPDARSLREKIDKLLAEPAESLSQLRCNLAVASNERQSQINAEAAAPFATAPRASEFNLPSVAVIIPFFNTPIRQVADLLWSLAQQTVSPNEIIVVNDASTAEASAQLNELIRRYEPQFSKIVVIKHEENKGLAGARNTGLKNVSTDLTICIDSDDVAMNTFISDIARSFMLNADIDAVVPYLEAFDDGTDFVFGSTNGYVYRPLGDGVIAAQTDNILGHANAGFRTETLRSFGGWDQTSRAMWEDYALYMRLVSSGRKIAVLPKTGVLYRVNPNSMARTYSKWPAMRLVALNTVGLPRFEAFRLQAALRELHTLHSSAGQAALENQRLRSALEDLNHRIHVGFPSEGRGETEADTRYEPNPLSQRVLNSEMELDDLRRRCLALAHWAVSPKERRSRARRYLSEVTEATGVKRRSVLGGIFKRITHPKYERMRGLVLASGFFDVKWYLGQYQDVQDVDPLDHYIMHGGVEGRSPGPNFNGSAYLSMYPDVAESGLNPLVHYLRYGAIEGRQIMR
ncbi:glycosyltransferase [Ensifer sp. MJa1]|uniref:glycosyltransferase n=1 Tax=Ensifer sp. MJa1 TaxID=2919888 RepID=UPI00300B05E6